jgi:hypothetical protein
MISEKQLEANKENAKSGGVKTEGGKEISKYNALKHGVFSQTYSEYEQDETTKIIESLNRTFEPSSFEENMLISRLAGYLIKQARVNKAETEYMIMALNPDVVQSKDWSLSDTTVIEEGYKPKIDDINIEVLSNTYLRYQINIENHTDKTIDRLKTLKKQKSEKIQENSIIPIKNGTKYDNKSEFSESPSV